MPELAEVEVVRRNLVRWWQGRGASQVFLYDEKLLSGGTTEALKRALSTVLENVERRGKYLICHMEDQAVVVFHFRMTGKIICTREGEPKYARLAWYIEDSGWLVFKDQRRLGDVWVLRQQEFENFGPIQKMGPEPYEVTVEELRGACSDRRLLKTALLDQSIVAGVGNIAISELYWRLGFPPDVKCGELDDQDWQRLVESMPPYFDELIENSMADEIEFVNEGGSSSIFKVYGRLDEECSRCRGTINKTKIGGRTSYYCGDCQR